MKIERARRRMAVLSFSFFLVGCFAFPAAGPARPAIPSVTGPDFLEFEKELENLRRLLRIPGMAAGVVKDRRLVWTKGFGFADAENGIEASPETPWHVASVAKTFTAVVVLQLAEEGKLSLDDPLEKFGIHIKSRGAVRIRHILTHTSERMPGTFFRYSGRLWEHLAQVIREASGLSYKENLVDRIIRPLGLTDTAPNKETESEAYAFEGIRNRTAVPYGLDASFRLRRSDYGLGFYAAGGTFTSVRDFAAYLTAIDGDRLLKPETREMMFTPYAAANGKPFPHGLGWFMQSLGGRSLIWHFGWHPDHASALVIRIPEKNLSFMAFANTDKLSQPFNLLRGNILNSPAALLFLRMIAFAGESVDEIAEKESETNDIILKTSGRKPVASVAEKGIVAICLTSYLSTPLLWAVGRLRRRKTQGKAAIPASGHRPGSAFSRIYALLILLLCLLIGLALIRAPFLVYWPELPGWIDGISLEENLFLAMPTLLALLSIGLILLTAWIWRKKYWSRLERLHYTWLNISLIGLLLLLNHWHLIGFSYYWNYLIR